MLFGAGGAAELERKKEEEEEVGRRKRVPLVAVAPSRSRAP